MRYFLPLAALSALFSSGLAFPGFGKALAEIKARAASPIASVEDSNELLGDLVSPGPSTPVGQAIADILMGKADSQSNEVYKAPGALGTPACQQDACCVWKYIADDMTAKFKGDSGRCNLFARGAVRLGFHDAGAWKKGMTDGGADGSMILTDEITRPINRGLEEIVNEMRNWYNKYQQYDAGAADLIQMGATVATVVCPLGPRIRSFVGRIDNNKLPPEGLLPDVKASANDLIRLFEDKTIKPNGLVALVGAHTTSQQRFFKPSEAFDPQDSTPGVWDVLFYNQTLTKAPQRVVKFTSDVSFSSHPRMQKEWVAFTDPKTGQAHWNDDFAKEYIRLSMLGVNNINKLTECTKVLPPFIADFAAPDNDQVTQWAMGGFSNYGQAIGQLLDNGQRVTGEKLNSSGINPKDGNNRQPPAAGSPFFRPPPQPAPVHQPPPKPAAPSTPKNPGQPEQPNPKAPQQPRPAPPPASTPPAPKSPGGQPSQPPKSAPAPASTQPVPKPPGSQSSQPPGPAPPKASERPEPKGPKGPDQPKVNSSVQTAQQSSQLSQLPPVRTSIAVSAPSAPPKASAPSREPPRQPPGSEAPRASISREAPTSPKTPQQPTPAPQPKQSSSANAPVQSPPPESRSPKLQPSSQSVAAPRPASTSLRPALPAQSQTSAVPVRQTSKAASQPTPKAPEPKAPEQSAPAPKAPEPKPSAPKASAPAPASKAPEPKPSAPKASAPAPAPKEPEPKPSVPKASAPASKAPEPKPSAPKASAPAPAPKEPEPKPAAPKASAPAPATKAPEPKSSAPKASASAPKASEPKSANAKASAPKSASQQSQPKKAVQQPKSVGGRGRK